MLLPRRHVAIHESGHAVISAVRGIRFRCVSIVRNGTELGRVEMHHPRPGEMHNPCCIRRHVLVRFAGDIAETRARRDGRENLGMVDDLRAVIALVRRLPGCRRNTIHARARQLSSLHTQSEALVRIHWPAIDAVAKLLLERSVLTEADVHGALRTLRRA